MMNEHLSLYLRYLDVERGYSVNTVKTYGRILEDFLEILRQQGKTLRRLGKQELGEYVLILRQERQNSSKSIRLKLQAIKSFFAFLSEHTRALKHSPFGKQDFRYKVEHREVESLSESQLYALLEAVEVRKQNTLEGLKRATGKKRLWQKRVFAAGRDLCLLTLLASTGLRISEALGIRLADIDFVDKSILIRGKGKKIRKVFFDLPQAEQRLLSYIQMWRPLKVDHEYLFVSIKQYRPLSTRGAQKLLKEYLLKTGLRASVSPHTLRHSFATVAIEKGANIKAVSQILGHANCSITIDLYTHLSNEHLREVMQKCNPLCSVEIPLEERIEMRKKHLAYLDKTG
jgi:site-specific recombinase XerD